MRGKTGTLGAISSLAAVAAAAALAAGPAGAVTAASGTTAARMTAARRRRRPGRPPGARSGAGRPQCWPGTASTAKAGPRDDSAGPRSRRSSSIFSGAALEGVSCTGRKQCTATGLASTRTGKNYKPLAERWNGTTWAKQTTPIPNSGGLLGGTLTAGVSCTSSSACMAAGYSYSAKTVRLLGEGWNGRTWSIQPDSTPATDGRALPHLLHLGQGLHRRGEPELRHDPGRALERQEMVRADHQAHGRTRRRGLPRHRELHGRRLERRGEGARRALERQGLVGRVPGEPAAGHLPGERVLPGHHRLHRGRHGRHRLRHGAGHGPPGRGVDRRHLDRPHRPGPGSLRRSGGAQLGVVYLGHELHGRRRRPERRRHRGRDRGGPVERHDLDDRRHAEPGDVQRAPLGVVHLAYLLLGRRREQPTATGAVSPVAETWNGSTWSLQTAAG